MNTNKSNVPILIITFLIFLGIISRVIKITNINDFPNFTAIIAISVLSGMFFKNRIIAIMIPLIAMVVSDLIIGFNLLNIIWIYIPLIFITYSSFSIKNNNYEQITNRFVAGPIIFFLISNLGVWITSGMYLKNFNGLIQCYIAGIPFLNNSLISTFLYGFILLYLLDFIPQKNAELHT